jgi:hypothetical protein
MAMLPLLRYVTYYRQFGNIDMAQQNIIFD